MLVTDSLPDDLLEELSPHPDIYALFQHYNELYFEGKLGACSVQWSSGKMTMYTLRELTRFGLQVLAP